MGDSLTNKWKDVVKSSNTTLNDVKAIEEQKEEETSIELKSALKNKGIGSLKTRAKLRQFARQLFKPEVADERKTILFVDTKKKNLAYHDKNVYNILKLRKQTEIIRDGRNATPQPLSSTDLEDIEESFEQQERKEHTNVLWDSLLDNFVKRKLPSASDASIDSKLTEILPSMDEITTELVDRIDSTEILDVESTLRHIKEDRKSHPSANAPKNFIKLTLNETDDMVLFESVSLTVQKGTNDAEEVEKYNSEYEYLTRGPGKNRRTSDAEVQTEIFLVKSRAANTERIKKQDQESFVSNFEMFDTYADLAKRTKEVQLDDESHSKMEVTTYSREGENIDEMLNENENFHLSSMILQRLLAGNVYRERQRRYRNMIETNPLDLNLKYLYRIQTMWTFKCVDTMNENVVDMSWCHTNGDLLAVGYGAYYYRDSKSRNSGAVLLWSIKNPVNPERRYCYNIPVTAVEFSQKNPQLLAVALYDGSVEVLDVTGMQHIVVAKSERFSSPGFEPIWQIQWIQQKDKEFIITASQDGRIMKYEIATGPNLVGYRQLRLDRIEGVVEALSVDHKKSFIEADRHPQALCLKKHPKNCEMFYVGTDEGCIHICSVNFPHQHLSVMQVHNSGVYAIDFSPFSPKIFLTAGSDWTIRIWIEDILEPILELSDGFTAIHYATWSPIHATIIASCTQHSVHIWDLRRKNLKPASIRTFDNCQLTVIKFSPCGRSLLIGDDKGNTHVCSLEDFPFPPHFQYDELKKALFKSLTNKQELEKQVNLKLGHLGYEAKEQKNEFKCK